MNRRPTLSQALFGGALLTALLVASLVWVLLSAWERSIDREASARDEVATRRATQLVDDYLGRLRRAVLEIVERRRAGVCGLDNSASAGECLLGSVAADDSIAEATFTSAGGWQASAYRPRNDAPPCTARTVQEADGFVSTRHCEGVTAVIHVNDPRDSPTYETPAGATGDELLWSDLSYAALDADRPEAERRVVVNVLDPVHDSAGQLLGVLRITALEAQLDQAFAGLRVVEADPNDPFRVFLTDDRGRLLTRFHPTDRLRLDGDDLRIVPDDVPKPIAAALSHVEGATFITDGQRFRVSFTPLEGTQDWRVGVLGPADYFRREPARAQRLMALLAIGVLALVGILLALVSAAVRRGLGSITRETTRMQSLDFTMAKVNTPFSDLEAVLAGLERAKTSMRTLGRYAPIDLVRQLYAANVEPSLGGERRRLTLAFTDIKDFTTFAETCTPERLATLLGLYFQAMTEAVLAEGGSVDKYIGDALMVMWNAPTLQTHHEARACRAALACKAATERLFASEAWKGTMPLVTRFGIHTDDVMVGHFGAPSRFSYTALGDGVNLASRLEGLNKEYGTTIMVSGTVEAAVRTELDLRRLDRVAVKGKTNAVEVFELLGPPGCRTEKHTKYELAFAAYLGRDFAQAVTILKAQLDDAPSAALHRRALELIATPPPSDWSGVYAATHK